jgi:septin family protein
LNDIEKYNVKIYEFPLCDSDDDEEFKKIDEEIKSAIPFGVIGSSTIIESGNKRIRGRVYPWGIIDIDSDSCDFSKLRTFLCSSHMQDLKDITHDVHYENFRTDYIQAQQNTSDTKYYLLQINLFFSFCFIFLLF